MKNSFKCYGPFLLSIVGILIILQDYAFQSTKSLTITGVSVLMALLIRSIPEVLHHGSPNDEFKHNMNELVKTYGFILTKLENVPNVKDYTYYKYETFEQILNKAMDTRTNIYYLHDNATCDFLLIDQGNIYIYTLKENDTLFSRLDTYYVEIQGYQK